MINGMHHVSAITKNIQKNYYFMTEILGFRLVKKTVNQDDTSMYHLFYADYLGTPGTDMTFFEIKNATETRFGTNAISKTIFRVKNADALNYWMERFNEYGVQHDSVTEYEGKQALNFYDTENQRMMLIVDPVDESSEPFGNNRSIENSYRITSIHGVEITVQYQQPMTDFLHLLGGNIEKDYKDKEDTKIQFGHDYVYVKEMRQNMIEQQGFGSVHHFALSVDDEEQLLEIEKLVNEEKYLNSGIKDRFYFKALYVIAPGNITIEISTDSPGFTTDEDLYSLGESLALPPFLEEQRTFIELYLNPITKNQ